MGLKIEFIRSKLARRIFILFVCCALLPIAALSLLSFKHVSNQLEEQGRYQLEQTTRAVSMTIYKRLLFLEDELRLITSKVADKKVVLIEPVSLTNSKQKFHFKSAALISESGQMKTIFGQVVNLPVIPPEIRETQKQGRAVLLIQNSTGASASIFMAMPIDAQTPEKGVVLGEINSEYLWGMDQLETLPYPTKIAVLDQSQNIIFSSFDNPDRLIEKVAVETAGSENRQFVWVDGNHEQLGCIRALFLKSRFLASNWTVVLSQPQGDVLAPMQNFKKIFLLVILLSLWIVLLLSLVSIRRSLVPLEKLKEGTQRIASGDFNSPVEVSSGDEFEELTDAFNKMGRQLGRQFKALKTIAKIGQATATVLEANKLLKTVMNLLEELLDYDHGMIMLVHQEKMELGYAAGYGYHNDQERFLRQMRFDINGSETGNYILWSLKAQKPILLNNIDENDHGFPEGFLQFAHQRHVRSLICVPIVYKNESLGVLTAESSSSAKSFTLSDQSLLMGLAFQTAIGISNAQSFKKLQESEARFRKAFDNAGSGMALVDMDGHLLEVNNQLARIFGYSEEELLGKTLNDLTHPDDRHIGLKSLKQMATGEISSTWFEKRYTHMDGRVLWTTNSATALHDKNNNPVNFILHIQNLTDQKIAEEEKKQLEAHLQQSQKMEAIGTLAGGIAHDFNNILSAIMGYVDLAALDAEEGTPLSKNLASINAASERAVELVRQILAFSRPSKKDKKPVSINMVVEEALQLIRASLPATIEIRSNDCDKPLSVMGDPTQIHQIVMNLCTNAHHAMLAKGGTLDISLTSVELDYDNVRAYPNLEPGSYVKLTIADTGQGMNTDTLNRIFDPYFTTKEKGKGTGLGLAVVHGIVKGHGGFIDVRSKPGKGTTFDLFFPLIVETVKPRDDQPDIIPTGNERILFVDDEVVLTELNKETIHRLGYQVECMTNPVEAYEAFSAEPDRFDLVITDMVMPKMTGDQLADKIMQIRQDIPIILCTGYNDLITEEKAYKMGIRDFLMKPLSMKDLAHSIRNAIDQPG